MSMVRATGTSTASAECPSGRRLSFGYVRAWRVSTDTTPVSLTISEEGVGVVFETEVINAFAFEWPSFHFAAGDVDRNFTVACAGFNVEIGCHAPVE